MSRVLTNTINKCAQSHMHNSSWETFGRHFLHYVKYIWETHFEKRPFCVHFPLSVDQAWYIYGINYISIQQRMHTVLWKLCIEKFICCKNYDKWQHFLWWKKKAYIHSQHACGKEVVRLDGVRTYFKFHVWFRQTQQKAKALWLRSEKLNLKISSNCQ